MNTASDCDLFQSKCRLRNGTNEVIRFGPQLGLILAVCKVDSLIQYYKVFHCMVVKLGLS